MSRGRFNWQRDSTGWAARYTLRSAEGLSEVWAVKRASGAPNYHQEYFGWAYRAAGEDEKRVELQVEAARSEWFRGYSRRAAEIAAGLHRRGVKVDASDIQDRPRVYQRSKEAIRVCEDVLIRGRLKRAELPLLPLCLVCRHLVWSNATGGYSEYTPGSDLSVGCGKGYWSFDNETTTPLEWARMITTAESCNDFDPVQQIRRGAMVVPAEPQDEPSRGRRAYDLAGDPHE